MNIKLSVIGIGGEKQEFISIGIKNDILCNAIKKENNWSFVMKCNLLFFFCDIHNCSLIKQKYSLS